jgi:hypothetical protein
MVTIKRTMEPEIKEKAEQREKSGIKQDKPLGNFPEGGRVSNILGSYIGVSGKTLRKAEKIVKAAEQQPEIKQES